MDYGFDIPTRGPLASPGNITNISQRGESLGFNTVYINDHIVIPQKIHSHYPYSEHGDWKGGEFGEALDVLSLLAFLASVTKKIRLLTSVMVVPYRPPVVTAKMIASIDVLSKARVTIGCGAGWMEEEFLAVGAPAFADRGIVTDEYIEVFREIWGSKNPKFDGIYSNFKDISALPNPTQDPLPLWLSLIHI